MKSPKLMDLYSDYLLTSPDSASAQVMVKVLNDCYSHDSVTRMLAQPELGQKVFWKQIKSVIRQVESEQGVISIDDSLEHKPHSTENELISWHFDHSQGCSVKGINLVTFTYVNELSSGTKVKMPLAWELVRKDKIVEKTEKKGGKFITCQVRQASVSKKSKTWLQVSQADLEPDRTYLVHVKDIPFTLCLIKKVYHNLDGSTGVQYLLSSDTDQEVKDIDQTYQKRWSSEDLHRSLKQNTALEKMPAKMACSQANHIFGSMLAQIKLESLKIATKLNHYALKKQILIEALKTAWKYLQEIKQWASEKNATFPNFNPA